jgi:hypothetical protein
VVSKANSLGPSIVTLRETSLSINVSRKVRHEPAVRHCRSKYEPFNEVSTLTGPIFIRDEEYLKDGKYPEGAKYLKTPSSGKGPSSATPGSAKPMHTGY